MARIDWTKKVIQDDNRSLWIDFYNEKSQSFSMSLQSMNNMKKSELEQINNELLVP